MNGTWRNWAVHAALAAAIVAAFTSIGLPAIAGALIATAWFWGKETGEKSKDWSAPRRPWSDFNPADPRWSIDDRLDLLMPVAAATIMALVLP